VWSSGWIYFTTKKKNEEDDDDNVIESWWCWNENAMKRNWMRWHAKVKWINCGNDTNNHHVDEIETTSNSSLQQRSMPHISLSSWTWRWRWLVDWTDGKTSHNHIFIFFFLDLIILSCCWSRFNGLYVIIITALRDDMVSVSSELRHFSSQRVCKLWLSSFNFQI
jgi:hypothetical protein